MIPTARKWILWAAVLVAIAGALFYYRDSLSVAKFQAFVDGFSPTVLIVAFMLLPLLGSPISVFLIAAGLRFGFPLGVAVTSGCLIVHHLIAFRIAHGRWRQSVQHAIARKGRKIPELAPDHQAGWTALFAAVAGPPYAIKLYLLALTNIRFRIYFGVGVPVYTLCSMPALAAGAMAGRFSGWWFSLAGVVIATGVIATRLLRKRAVARKATTPNVT
jgi:uncharacterized membrane protein YdjX (TVP38/TMEM64 family)